MPEADYRQVVYRTNLDYYQTKVKITESRTATIYEEEKGCFQVFFHCTGSVYRISPTGKIQVSYRSARDKKVTFYALKSMLVPKEGQRLMIRPVYQMVKIPFPIPKDLKLPWCDYEDRMISLSHYRATVTFAVLETVCCAFIVYGVCSLLTHL
jgi:hypothetical protein